MKFIKRDWIIKNAMFIFFIGFFIGLSDLTALSSYLGLGIMLISFYLMYLKSKEDKKK
tara:strand:+ start:7408 stop:7581 length:174 start_codon:yes stop_codon:yes gene_type:complete